MGYESGNKDGAKGMSYESRGKGENDGLKSAYSFRDLRVYQNLYKAMVIVLTRIIPKLPEEEKYDLKDQMRRACKAAPALVAEGYAKKNHRRQWQKYLDDAIGECNEMIHHLSVAIDVYKIELNWLRNLLKVMILPANNYIV